MYYVGQAAGRGSDEYSTTSSACTGVLANTRSTSTPESVLLQGTSHKVQVVLSMSSMNRPVCGDWLAMHGIGAPVGRSRPQSRGRPQFRPAAARFLCLAATEVIRVYSPYRLLWNRRTDVRSYGILFTAAPPSSPPRQHMSGCRRKNADVAHTGLKTQCEPARHLSNFDDAPKYGRTFQMSEILRAGRAYGNPKIRSATIFKICKHDSTRYLRDSTSKLIN